MGLALGSGCFSDLSLLQEVKVCGSESGTIQNIPTQIPQLALTLSTTLTISLTLTVILTLRLTPSLTLTLHRYFKLTNFCNSAAISP